MKFVIQPKKIVVSGNTLLMKPLSRRAANEFRDKMNASNESDEQERIGLDLIAANVTFEDGSPLDVDDVPADDLVEIMRRLVGGNPKGVSDFTGTP